MYFYLVLFIGIFNFQFCSADKFKVLEKDQDALQARVDLIQQATQTIDLAYFIWSNDDTAMQMLTLLRDAAKRGVKVRILVDSMCNKISPMMQIYLMSFGIVVKEYNPFSLFDINTWVHRMHNKLFIIDGKSLIMGGRNIEDSYFGLAKNNFLDRDAFLEGTAVNEAILFYNKLWKAPQVMLHLRPILLSAFKNPETLLNQAKESLNHHSFLKLDTGTSWTKRSSEVPTTNFVSDLPVTVKTKEPVYDRILQLASKANESVVIENPYLVITDQMMADFKAIIDKGVKIRILTNSLRSTDGIPAQAGYIGRKKELVQMGIELWELYTPTLAAHLKSAVIDGKTAIIGSYNLDKLSANQNLEDIVYIEDENIAHEILLYADEHLKKARRIGPDGKPEGSRYFFPDTSCGKILATHFFRYFLPFLKFAT